MLNLFVNRSMLYSQHQGSLYAAGAYGAPRRPPRRAAGGQTLQYTLEYTLKKRRKTLQVRILPDSLNRFRAFHTGMWVYIKLIYQGPLVSINRSILGIRSGGAGVYLYLLRIIS